MIDRAICALCAVACLVALSLPVASGKPTVIRVWQKPALQLACDKHGREEYARTCRARSRSM